MNGLFRKVWDILNQDDEFDDFQPPEGKTYGISPALIEFIENVSRDHPNTFIDFPFDPEERIRADRFEFSDEQEGHAQLILKKVPMFRRLLEKTCPSEMPQRRFWKVYFLLIHSYWTDKSSPMSPVGVPVPRARPATTTPSVTSSQPLSMRSVTPSTTTAPVSAPASLAKPSTTLPSRPPVSGLDSIKPLATVESAEGDEDYFEKLWQKQYGDAPLPQAETDESLALAGAVTSPVQQKAVVDHPQEDYNPFYSESPQPK